MNAKRNILLSVCSVCWLAACPEKRVSLEYAVVSSTLSSAPTSASETGDQPARAAGTRCSEGTPCQDKQVCVTGPCAAIHPGLTECAQARVYFDSGEAVLKPAAYPMMARLMRCLKAEHPMKLDIAGNSDARGTAAYNRALGERRARAVARYLQSLGVPQRQLITVSYGEARPRCTRQNETCWQRNRRARLALK